MKIAKPTISKTIEFLICISFLSLTFRHEISSICLYLTGFLSIIELTRRKTNYFDKNNVVLLFFISYFLVEIIGMFYTKNLYFGIKDIESKLLLLIGSLIIIAIKFSENQILKFLKFYVIGINLSLIYLMGMCFINYRETLIIPKYIDFSILMHPTYFSFCLLIAGIIILEFHNKIINNSFFKIVLLIFISIGIILTDSKAGLICYFITLIFFSVKYILKLKLKVKIIVFCLSIFASLFLVNQLSKSRFTELFSQLQTTNKFNNYTGSYNSTEIRIIIWRSAKNVIKENLIMGTGTGDIKDELIKQFKKTNFINGIEKEYNFHNQFLQIIGTFGIILGFPLILIYLKMFYNLIKEKKMFFSFLTLMFIINFLFESFLETKAGIETFVIFNTIYFSTNKEIKI